MEASANIHTPLSDSENNIAPHVILDLRAQAKSLEFSSDGHLFAASCNCEAALWDAKTFSLICNLDVPSNEGPLYTSFTPDGRAIWLASEEGIIARHGILSYAHNIPPIRTSYTISCIKSSPDGMYLAVAIKSSATLLDSTTSDAHDVKSSVKLYDCMGQELATLVAGGSDDYICSLSFTADGERLTGISEDGAMFVWDTDSRTLVAGPFPQPAPAFQVAYSLGNDLVASAGPTGQIKVWKKHIGQEKDIVAAAICHANLISGHRRRCVILDEGKKDQEQVSDRSECTPTRGRLTHHANISGDSLGSFWNRPAILRRRSRVPLQDLRPNDLDRSPRQCTTNAEKKHSNTKPKFGRLGLWNPFTGVANILNQGPLLIPSSSSDDDRPRRHKSTVLPRVVFTARRDVKWVKRSDLSSGNGKGRSAAPERRSSGGSDEWSVDSNSNDSYIALETRLSRRVWNFICIPKSLDHYDD